MLKTMSAKERLDRYINRNPREVKPFDRKDAAKNGNDSVKMK